MKKKQNSNNKEIEYEKGSGNVFADLGFENPNDELAKADLTAKISCIIKQKRLTQKQAAEILGVDQPRISSLLRGRLDLFSIEKLMQFLKALGQDIEIMIKPKPRNRKEANLFVSSCERISMPMVAKGTTKCL
jgi:predicted XRE-type DNA-binding protein